VQSGADAPVCENDESDEVSSPASSLSLDSRPASVRLEVHAHAHTRARAHAHGRTRASARARPQTAFRDASSSFPLHARQFLLPALLGSAAAAGVRVLQVRFASGP
jgi:hypothetical protein